MFDTIRLSLAPAWGPRQHYKCSCSSYNYWMTSCDIIPQHNTNMNCLQAVGIKILPSWLRIQWLISWIAISEVAARWAKRLHAPYCCQIWRQPWRPGDPLMPELSMDAITYKLVWCSFSLPMQSKTQNTVQALPMMADYQTLTQSRLQRPIRVHQGLNRVPFHWQVTEVWINV